MAAAVPPTDEEFRDWLGAVKRDVGVDDFVEVVGTDLLASKVLSAADFGTPPNSLQLAKLTRRMRSSGIRIADIETDETWQDDHLGWWEEHGAVFVERLQDKWKARASGGGAMTENMLSGKYLSVPEASFVVHHANFDELVRKLEAEDWTAARLLTKESDRFGQLVRKGALYFRELGGKAPKAAKDDHDRAALDAMLHRYSGLWSGKILMDTVRAVYTRREIYPPRFGEELHQALARIVSGNDADKALTKALALLVDTSEKLLPKCAESQLVKALGTALNVMHAMMDYVGPQAGRRAQDIVEVWGDADPHWDHYGEVYPSGKAGEEPFECVQRFVVPALDKWTREYWAALTAETVQAQVSSLESALKLDTLRNIPSAGIRIYEEQAAACGALAGAGSPLKRKSTQEAGEDAADKCKHCGTEKCFKSTCWRLHPELKPEWMQSRGRRGGKKAQAQRFLQQYAQQSALQPPQQQVQQYAHQQAPQPPQQQVQQYAQQVTPRYAQGQPHLQQFAQPPPVQQQVQPPGVAPPQGGAQHYAQPGAGAGGKPGGFVPLAERECFKCGQKGHIAAKCTAN